jgi:deoxyribonuclease-4
LLQTARIGALCGAQSIVFHAAFYLGDAPEKTYVMVKKYLSEVLTQLKKEKNRVWVRPEVMGKGSEFGTIDEVLQLSTELEGVAPCIDFAHWHARTGKFNSYPEFVSILRQVKERLGQTGLDNMHIHFSGIKYGAKGEISHLNLKDADLRYEELLRAFRDLPVKGLVICESPNLEEDALLLKETYQRLLKAG